LDAVTDAEQIGALVRSVTVPKQGNDPDITVRRLDLHAHGFIVRCEVGRGTKLKPAGLVAIDLRDSLYTRYEEVASGEDFVAYKPAIPSEAAWLKVFTKPETHIDLTN
jgi:hypothetical protein